VSLCFQCSSIVCFVSQAAYADLNGDTGQALQPTIASAPFIKATYAGFLASPAKSPYYVALGNVSIAVRGARGRARSGFKAQSDAIHQLCSTLLLPGLVQGMIQGI
jgi:hypothetical protein